jgi:hypothetical protein
MRLIELVWEDWRASIAVVRAKELTHMLEHADRLERQLDQYPPDAATVSLSLIDAALLRSSNWTRWQLGSPYHPTERR